MKCNMTEKVIIVKIKKYLMSLFFSFLIRQMIFFSKIVILDEETTIYFTGIKNCDAVNETSKDIYHLPSAHIIII